MLDQKKLEDLRFEQELATRLNYADTKLKIQRNDELRMREFWHRRKIFDLEKLRHQDEPRILQLAWGLSCYLTEKDIWFEDDVLAGNYGFTEYKGSTPFSFMEMYEHFLGDKAAGIAFDSDLIEMSLHMQEACLAKIGSGLHVIGGFGRTIHLGMDGIYRELELGVQKNGETPFLKAGMLCVRAASAYFERYSDTAATEASFEENPERRARMINIARACAWIAHKPPRTFREAIQLVVLLHEVIQIEERCGSLSFGRLDKYLYPFYRRDVDEGTLTPEQADEMIVSFWKKLMKNRWGWQNVTLGGYDGKDGFCCNDLTRICLRASRALRGDQPQLTFRCHPSMPDDIWDDIVELIRTGVGFPELYNDEMCFKAKELVGIPKEDAEQYAVLGCVELTIPEKEYSHTEGMRVNWPKILEIALTGGDCLVSSEHIPLLDPKPMNSFKSFDEFYGWFKREFLRFNDILMRAADEMHTAYGRHYPIPFLSSTMYGCAETGRDATESGTIYNHSCVNTCGQSTLVDSLCAIKKFVFEEKRFTLAQIVEMIRNDFAGYEAERHHIRRNCPRFGSDDEAADIMRDLTEAYGRLLTSSPNKRGGVREVGYYSVEAQASYGLETGATPDGRHRGEALSNGIAPSQGTEKYGPTAVYEAVASLPCEYMSNGLALDVKFHPRFFDAPEHRRKFIQTIKTYFALGGMQTQINVVDREILLAAQRDPDKHRDLVVRVSGFSAYFCDLSKAVQDEIIERSEYSDM